MMSPKHLTALLKAVSLFSAFVSATSPYTTANPSFINLLGQTPKVTQLAQSTKQMFHEAAVYHWETKALWVISDKIEEGNSTFHYVQRITGLESAATTKIEIINSSIPVPIGGFHYIQNTYFGDVILFAAQGGQQKSQPGGIYALNPYPPYNSSLVLGSYGTYPFNSPDDITVSSDGVMWLTDPIYGHLEGNRPDPILPNQVYSYDPLTGDARVVADGFGRPNGIAVSADQSTVYIGDTGASIGNGTTDFQGPRTIYAYDRNGKFLSNRRVFTMPNAAGGGADGIKTDRLGNVWACVTGGVDGDSVTAWNSEGVLLGSIALNGTVGNLGFGGPGELFVLGGDRLYRIDLDKRVVGAGF